MAPVVNMSGTGGPSTYSKQVLAVEMFYRGRDSALAGALLHQNVGQSYMALYLLCQAVELVGKSLLILHDYDSFKPTLRALGHDLVAILWACETEFKLAPFTPAFWREIAALNAFYVQNLRYASIADTFIDPRSIESKRTKRKLLAALKVARHHLPKSFLRP